MKKKYNLFTAISMVVGIIIGSGIFFKATVIMEYTGGNVFIGVISWLLGGLIMIISSITFSILSAKLNNCDGLYEYFYETSGENTAYYATFYSSFIYFPILVAVLSWISGKYLALFIGIEDDNISINFYTILFSMLFLSYIYFINAISPKIAGNFQILTTILKIVPIILIAFIGIINGLFNENKYLIQNVVNPPFGLEKKGFFNALCATAFAYDGWICTTTISGELKEKNMVSKSLIIGSLIVLFLYVFYYIGLLGILPTQYYITHHDNAVKDAYIAIFGNVGGKLVFLLIVISAIGTLNGLMMGNSRGAYSIAMKNQGFNPNIFKQVDKNTNSCYNSALIGFIISSTWLLIWLLDLKLLFQNYNFIDLSELAVIFMYLLYIPIYINMIIKYKELNFLKRFIMPILSILSSLFIIISSFIAHRQNSLYFLFIIIVTMLFGFIIKNKRK